MQRTSSLWLILTAGIAMSSVSLADDDDRDENRRNRFNNVRDYFECVFTPPVRFPGTIVDAAIATKDLSTLVTAVVGAGLVDTLNGPGPFTVYAPVNAAFEKIPGPILTDVLADTNVLTALLTYHVVPGTKADPRFAYSRIEDVKSVLGQTLFLNRGKSGPRVNQSNLVSCQPVKTTNGVVYLIDSVLQPQF